MTRTADRALSSGGMAPGVEHLPVADVLSPADRYQELFTAVQSGRVFADSKTFVDCVPNRDPAAILRLYRSERTQPGFDLARFVGRHFAPEPTPSSEYVSEPGQSLGAHIDGLWRVLTRRPDEHAGRSSLLPLPHEYIVPGGRFGEMYYWDSYFSMLGLAWSANMPLLRSMADNYAFLIDTYGHIPNGNRSYYLSRSQPPVFALMVGLFEQCGATPALHYLPQLRREHAFWMEGEEGLANGAAHRHVVKLPDGSLLNRYWDERDTPREESYLEDVTTAGRTQRESTGIYRDLRAGAASGWDFSSRWLGDARDLCTIRTTAILPVDLNSFLYAAEMTIARLSESSGDASGAADFQARASARRISINRYLWSDAEGAFLDYDWQLLEARPHLNAATATPLYVGLATAFQGHQVARAIQARLLAAGGVRTTEQMHGQQWDEPNGWAPLQRMAIAGLHRFGEVACAREIAHRWLATVAGLYERESKLVEKYVLHTEPGDAVGGGGGEYPLQDGFGWTNGVVRKLLDLYPEHHAHRCGAGRRKRWV